MEEGKMKSIVLNVVLKSWSGAKQRDRDED